MFVSVSASHGIPVQQRLFAQPSHSVRPSARKLIAARNRAYTEATRTSSIPEAYEAMYTYTIAVCEAVLNARLASLVTRKGTYRKQNAVTALAAATAGFTMSMAATPVTRCSSCDAEMAACMCVA